VSSDIILQPGQVLTEHWEVQYKGQPRIHKPVEEWVECRVVRMYHSTVYGGAAGRGTTVDEARLEAVLGLARAICDDVSAFQHDADEIFKAEMLRWFEETIKEQQDILDEEYEEKDRPKIDKKAQRRIKLLEELQAMWQEDHDYWPEKEEASRAAARAEVVREQTARRRAASARLSARATESQATADAS